MGTAIILIIIVILAVIVFLSGDDPKTNSIKQSIGLLSKDGLTQSEADDVVLDATHMSYGFSNFSLGQAEEKIRSIDRKLEEVKKMDDPVMRSAWSNWLNHYRRTAVNDREYYAKKFKTEENRRKAGL